MDRPDLLKNDRVFTSRHTVTFTKLNDPPKLDLFITSRNVLLYEVSRWRKEKTQNFSPTPSMAIPRIITSIITANNLELYSIDIEQDFLQTDELMEGVNDRYFINPSPGRPDANNKDIVYEVL